MVSSLCGTCLTFQYLEIYPVKYGIFLHKPAPDWGASLRFRPRKIVSGRISDAFPCIGPIPFNLGPGGAPGLADGSG